MRRDLAAADGHLPQPPLVERFLLRERALHLKLVRDGSREAGARFGVGASLAPLSALGATADSDEVVTNGCRRPQRREERG